MSSIFIDECYAEKILLNLWKQCEDTDLSDVVLIAGTEGKRIYAHRSIISAASEYFNAMFTSSMRESMAKEMEMRSVDGEVLHSLVEYCYTGRVTIRKDIVVEMLKTADMLLLAKVVTACENFLVDQLDPSNCLGFAILANQYRCETLLHNAKCYSNEYFMEVFMNDEFLKLNAEQLSPLLACDNLCVSDEGDVFNSLKAWIQHDPIEREKNKAELLKLVRMPLLKPLFLTEHVKPYCTSAECHKLYVEALECQLFSYSGLLDASKTIKRRRSDQYLMAITEDQPNYKICIHYYCPQQLKWKTCMNKLEYRRMFTVACMEDSLYIIGGYDVANNILNTVICLSLKTLTYKQVTPMPSSGVVSGVAVINGFCI